MNVFVVVVRLNEVTISLMRHIPRTCSAKMMRMIGTHWMTTTQRTVLARVFQGNAQMRYTCVINTCFASTG